VSGLILDDAHQIGSPAMGLVVSLVVRNGRCAMLTWKRGEATRVHLGAPTREVRYFNDLDEAAARAAAEVGT
jgi:hypothetical protein